ncbi:MAG TPA: non-reducing end alpha-L-arabinofuranosidase family hydrolase [Natronosporangium sp.]
MLATRHRFTVAAVSAILTLLGAALVFPITAQAQAAGCQVSYTILNQWPGGFTAAVDITNLGSQLSSWSLRWSFGAGQTIANIWNANRTQTGAEVTATNVDYNGTVPAGGTVSFGFNGTWSGSNPVPDAFTLNDVPCNGTQQPPTSAPPTTSPPPQQGSLPSSFQWTSSGVLAGPRPDAQHPDALAIKDFSVVRHNGQWLIYATTASPSGWGLVHFAFEDWPQAGSAPHTYLDTASAIGPGYRAAPQLFYFAPQDLWYLVYQTGPPTYSTSTDPADPTSWSAPQTFIAEEPPIVRDNKGPGQWIDFWVICDSANCYLFFSDDNGHIYRAETSLSNFPNGFGNTQIVLSDSRFALFEATNVYRVLGTDQYLLLQEAIGSDGRRWFRSYTADSLTGTWTPLAATESNPFARANNVSFPISAWTRDISHGELVRAGNDQTLPINPCNLRFVYQGMDPSAGGEYILLPWRMGLLTQTNSPC